MGRVSSKKMKYLRSIENRVHAGCASSVSPNRLNALRLTSPVKVDRTIAILSMEDMAPWLARDIYRAETTTPLEG